MPSVAEVSITSKMPGRWRIGTARPGSRFHRTFTWATEQSGGRGVGGPVLAQSIR